MRVGHAPARASLQALDGAALRRQAGPGATSRQTAMTEHEAAALAPSHCAPCVARYPMAMQLVQVGVELHPRAR